MKTFAIILVSSVLLSLTSCGRSGISQRTVTDDIYYSPSSDPDAFTDATTYTTQPANTARSSSSSSRQSNTGSAQRQSNPPVNTQDYEWYGQNDGNSNYLGSERMEPVQDQSQYDTQQRSANGDTYITNNYGDNYYDDDDFYYSSRARRMYQPVFGATYFSPFYDPFNPFFYDPWMRPGLSVGIGFGGGWGFSPWNRPWGMGMGMGWGMGWGSPWYNPYNPWGWGGMGWGGGWGNPWYNPWCPWGMGGYGYGGFGYGHGGFAGGSDYSGGNIYYGHRNRTGTNTVTDPRPGYQSNVEDRSPRTGGTADDGPRVPRNNADDVLRDRSGNQSETGTARNNEVLRPAPAFQNPVRANSAAQEVQSGAAAGATTRPGAAGSSIPTAGQAAGAASEAGRLQPTYTRPSSIGAQQAPNSGPGMNAQSNRPSSGIQRPAQGPVNQPAPNAGPTRPGSVVDRSASTADRAGQSASTDRGYSPAPAPPSRGSVDRRVPYSGPRSAAPAPSSGSYRNYPSTSPSPGASPSRPGPTYNPGTRPSSPATSPSGGFRGPERAAPSRSPTRSSGGSFGGSRGSSPSRSYSAPSGGSRSSGGSYSGGGSRSSGGGSRSSGGSRPR